MKEIIFLSGFALFIATSCTRNHRQEHHTTHYLVSSSILKDTSINQEYVAQIHAYQHIELRSLEKGYLYKVLVDEGQYVQKGDLLFQIQPNVFQAEAQKAQSELEFAEVEYQNTLALADRNIVSQSEVKLSKAKLGKAKAELSLALTHLGFTEIRAPFNGIVGKFENVRLGSLLDEGELLTTLSDNSKMWVYFNVPESEYLDYASRAKKKDEHVHLKLANDLVFQEEGIIETIESDFNNKTGNIAFRATFKNTNGLLRHGQTGNIIWTKKLTNINIIPQKATFDILEKKFVYLVNHEGLVKSQEITIESELNYIYLVKKGIKPSDRFVLDGVQKIKNGDIIVSQFVKPQQVLSNLNLHAE